MQRTIKENVEDIRRRITEACTRAERDPSEVTLIAVSKTRTAEEVMAAAACGIKDFGENKVQEILEKYPAVTAPVRWHMIGHLQTNKVKSITDKVCMIHSVDSLHLAEEINKRTPAGRTTDILLEINIAGEESKFGVKPEETQALINEILDKCPALVIKGLMTVAPAAEDPETVRPYFRALKELAVKNKLEILSMGMSSDFEVAIEEGATHVRVGTAIFGQRNYKREV